MRGAGIKPLNGAGQGVWPVTTGLAGCLTARKRRVGRKGPVLYQKLPARSRKSADILQPAPARHRHHGTFTHHDVVKDPDLYQRQRIPQAPGDGAVGLARLGAA